MLTVGLILEDKFSISFTCTDSEAHQAKDAARSCVAVWIASRTRSAPSRETGAAGPMDRSRVQGHLPARRSKNLHVRSVQLVPIVLSLGRGSTVS